MVDNGSHDGSVAALAREFPSVRVVTLATNLGYAGGVNRGVAATARARRRGVERRRRGRAGHGGGDAGADRRRARPRRGGPGRSGTPTAPSTRRPAPIPSPGDAVGHALLGLVRPSNRFTRRYRQLDVDPARPRDVEWLSGAALWLRRSALESVGGWDEHYFMYMEDVDLCWRLRRLGWRVAYEPGRSASCTCRRSAPTGTRTA